MGNRVSIQFVNHKQKSVVLFSHWQGKRLVKLANQYVNELYDDISKGKISPGMPLYRMEPDTAMVDFIRWLVADNPNQRIESDFYLGADEHSGDNSDNGHFDIFLNIEEKI